MLYLTFNFSFFVTRMLFNSEKEYWLGKILHSLTVFTQSATEVTSSWWRNRNKTRSWYSGI